ncbi:alpha/beta hydrolase [Brevibacterium daeguense]|uniref:Alpha/beta hydrolase n=1 Tax=Brevibacterium daeguense TaxID=909936 RepID=A0ABP8EIK7_9MICO
MRVVIIHGGGGNTAAMWPIAAHIAHLGAHVTVADLPGYGRTQPLADSRVTYADWQDLLVDLVEGLLAEDDRPLILLGASMGGMLALDVAAVVPQVSTVIATCLLDLSDPDVQKHVVRSPLLVPLSNMLVSAVHGRAESARIPMKLVTPMEDVSNDPALSAEVMADGRGGGVRMPLGWFAGLLEGGPAVPAEEYAGAPVVLVHPAEDRWTPPEVSRNYLDRLPVETRYVELPGCGHFPAEKPGFDVLLRTVTEVIAEFSESWTARREGLADARGTR